MNENNLSGDSETLFITLYERAFASKRYAILKDETAEEIVDKIDYDFSNIKRIKNSKFLAIYMAMRASLFDDFTNEFIENHPNSIIIHLGCGLDPRINRIKRRPKFFYDLDLAPVISLRKEFFTDDDSYKMISSSVTDLNWLDLVDYNDEDVLIIAEGLIMYLTEDEINNIFISFKNKFKKSTFMFDAYSKLALKLSKYKNPANDVGASLKWALNDPKSIENIDSSIKHIKTQFGADKQKANQLEGLTKIMFKMIYMPKFARKLYRIFTFKIG